MPMHNPPHPGQVIKHACLEPLGLTVTAGAKGLGVSRNTLSMLLNGRLGISTEMAIRLSKAFGGSPESWLQQQMQYDLWLARRRKGKIRVRKFETASERPHKPRIYTYVVSHDIGVAPNIDGGVCTISLCKPRIRKAAQVGDWIVGLWPKRQKKWPPGHEKRLTFVMRVGEKLTFQDYWNDVRFQMKKPGATRTPDNIYEPRRQRSTGEWAFKKSKTWVHAGEDHKKRDLSGLYVLVADRFWYFGEVTCQLPKQYWELDLLSSRRNHRVTEWPTEKLDKFVHWLETRDHGVLGQPRDRQEIPANSCGTTPANRSAARKSACR